MLKRAEISAVVACVAAFWGFTGFFPVTEVLGRALFLAASGFVVLSLLFSLFEDAPESGKPSSATVPLTHGTGFQPTLDDRPPPVLS